MMIKEIFGKVKIYRLLTRVDNRGSLEYVFDENTAIFKVRETRIYSIPKEGTFFGIHYREESNPMTKFVTVIRGRGLDYIIDLREESPTYLEWESIELSEENAFAVLIPAGFGHAFISLQNDTIQLYSVDRSGNEAHSKQINYKDSKIGLKLPIPISEISDYDLSAPFVSESGEEFVLDTPIWNVRTNAFYTKLGYVEVSRDNEFIYYIKKCE
ncbi:dTDP-4-dehydrorhamnose 3,5-epimerase family protein [Butyrivibrio sp. MB2005]|uniref:dTDP-4-dehydrorhamnose 3,5-epimerase family protein n=1 Tax=Butyrivibrio sp. MB2005 TaxID=1280678 RepID=UPI000405F8D9|nr:dTDP-4-dehydrorhamnose 3,5-epimerase [Butyrivibrio sp. MB2005]